uniref:NUDIX hydrolase n=1 Tax=Paenirhodobacter enshiensis TaxID=1105367 RepID=UPI0035B0DD2F
MLRKIWTEFILLLLRRPARYQVAALCWRPAGAPEGTSGTDAPRTGEIEVLLVSSLTTHRWILPKGWPKDGRSGAETALEEAWEEAGIRIIGEPPVHIGRYAYHKRLRGDVPVRTLVDVFAVRIRGLLDHYPEEGRRERVWLSPAEAADRVQEPELKALLRDCARRISAAAAQA